MAVVLGNTKKQNGVSPLASHGTPGQRRKAHWRNRDADPESSRRMVHLAESESHKAWVKEKVPILAAEPTAHELWIQRTLECDREAHQSWVEAQRLRAAQVRGTADSHEDWLYDMQVPDDLMDGGKEMQEMAAQYCQAVWRGMKLRQEALKIKQNHTAEGGGALAAVSRAAVGQAVVHERKKTLERLQRLPGNKVEPVAGAAPPHQKSPPPVTPSSQPGPPSPVAELKSKAKLAREQTEELRKANKVLAASLASPTLSAPAKETLPADGEAEDAMIEVQKLSV